MRVGWEVTSFISWLIDWKEGRKSEFDAQLVSRHLFDVWYWFTRWCDIYFNKLSDIIDEYSHWTETRQDKQGESRWNCNSSLFRGLVEVQLLTVVCIGNLMLISSAKASLTREESEVDWMKSCFELIDGFLLCNNVEIWYEIIIHNEVFYPMFFKCTNSMLHQMFVFMTLWLIDE